MSKTVEILKALCKVDHLHNALIVGRDGFVIKGQGDINFEDVGNKIATAIGTTEAMGQSTEHGSLTEIMVEYEEGTIIVAPIGNEAILGAIASEEANLNRIRYEFKKALQKLKKEI